MDYRAKTLLDARRENLERALGRKLTVPPPSDRPENHRPGTQANGPEDEIGPARFHPLPV